MSRGQMSSDQIWAMSQATTGKMSKVFDWDKAATLIVEKGAQSAEAGLMEDWNWTSGSILEGGKPILERNMSHLASRWATPVVVIDGEEIECWRHPSEVPEWDAETFWPSSALEILEGEELSKI